MLGNVYTYTLSNAADARQKIDMVLFPTVHFVSISMDDPDWLATCVGVSAVGKGLLPGGKPLTFTAVAQEGTTPGITAAEIYTFVPPSAPTVSGVALAAGDSSLSIQALATLHPGLNDLFMKETRAGVGLHVLGPIGSVLPGVIQP